MIKNEVILSAIYMIQDYSKGSHFLEETVDRVLTELKLLDKELEALQQPKSCEGCKWDDIPFPSNQFHCDECKHAYSCYNDNFEPKEQ